MEEALKKYIKNYDTSDPDINYKYYHSYRVMENSSVLAEALNLSEQDKKIALIIGLYHDIGRFEQDKLYDTYNDIKKFDHADYGVKVLFEQNLIKQIPVEEKYYRIIEKGVKNHNKYKIEEGLSEQELLHAKIIRDADKIDILYAASEKLFAQKSLDYQDEIFEISNDIKKQFYSKKTIRRGRKTNSEKIISYLALVFDLNFKESAKYLLEKNILENLYEVIKNKEKYKEYFDCALEHLKEMEKC